MTRRSFWTCAIVLLALPVAAAQLDTNDLLRCHAIASREERLDCYEALAVAAQSAATTTPRTAPEAAPAASVAATGSSATANHAPAGNATAAAGSTAAASYAPAGNAAAAVGSATPPAAAANPETEGNFGLSRRQIEPQSSAQRLTSIKSVVSQITQDRLHNITVVLDNGQTWAFIEPEPRLRPGDTVTIKHASLGSFLMLTPSRRSYRVERLK